MLQDDITVGDFSGPSDRDRFVVMTLTAAEALQFILAGFCPEMPSLVSFGYLNGIHRKRPDRIDLLLIIKWGCRIFVDLNDAVISGICGAPGKKDKQRRYNIPKTIF